jgi:hypothetical protein
VINQTQVARRPRLARRHRAAGRGRSPRTRTSPRAVLEMLTARPVRAPPKVHPSRGEDVEHRTARVPRFSRWSGREPARGGRRENPMWSGFRCCLRAGAEVGSCSLSCPAEHEASRGSRAALPHMSCVASHRVYHEHTNQCPCIGAHSVARTRQTLQIGPAKTAIFLGCLTNDRWRDSLRVDDPVWHESELEPDAPIVGDGDTRRPRLADDPLDDEGSVMALQRGRVGPRGRRPRAPTRTASR